MQYPKEYQRLRTKDLLIEILERVRDIQRRSFLMSVELDALIVQVEENTTVEQSAIILLEGIAAQLLAAKDEPAKIAAISAQLKTSADALAAALIANTPAGPAVS